MSKEEFLKIQTCVLKVNIHCDGCKSKVKKILQKIEGVYTTKIDAEQGKVTVSGNVDPNTIIKKLAKSGKHAEIWGSKPTISNNNQNQSKNMQIDNGKAGNKAPKGGNNQQQQQPPKGGAGGGGQPSQQQLQQFQQLQQLQQMKGFQDMKGLPQLKDMKMPFKAPPNQGNNQKAVKFNIPEDDEDMTDDEFDDFDDDDDYDDEDDDEFEDEMDHLPPNKMKPPPMMGGHGPQGQIPNMMMMNGMMNPQLMNGPQGKNGAMGGPMLGANNGKKGGPGAMPVPVNGMGGNGDGKNGKKGNGGAPNGGNPNQGPGGPSGKNGGKSGGGDPKNGNNNNGGGGGNKNGGPNGAKKGGGGSNGGGVQPMNNLPPGLQQHLGQMGQMPNMPMGQMPKGNGGGGPMGHMSAVQGLPAGMSSGGGAGGYGPGPGPGQEMMPGNAYQQQLAAMMNQQRTAMVGGNDRFQPMMYARPPPAVNYMPAPYPYPYPYPQQQPPHPPPGDTYTDYFNDENTSSCNVM